ncbi:MAG: DegV family protein [Chloroflexi bacterium]|jgi:DegV family protein with EDD domain|nr:DegV family protein [Chloroflexota bacterium]MBT3863846.1 DegV family protein [Chloroflexota bacterium]MBT4142930.1 DegV family protein [Chloroflexota bacterium]MBT4942992.1 DegV family protein [Chloroflexota bacterium]MBT5252076.1 DegV family protein [Chloroflexota bacterium]
MSIAVVTDSTSDLPVDIAKQHGITIVPLNVHIEDETFLDGVTISADEMYRRLPDQKVIPTTSAPSVGSFIEAYEKLSESHDEIISIHLSSKLSLTHNSAVQAASELNEKGAKIEVIDTEQASMALGWIAVQAAEKIASGGSLDEAVALAKSASTRASFTGMVDTLEYLVRGGRIGKAQGFVGSLLRIRPILTLTEGVAHPAGRARNRTKGITRLKEMVAEASPLDKLAILYTTDKNDAEEIANSVAEYSKNGKPVVAQLGPVVGNYLGPGTLGLGLIRSE